ncbi:hypothetical protein ACIRPP_02695 [Streptomyces sp. NPDC101219]|uniref:hypothetical protein n=1 Tax=Streptomyces sp. NPDC101219 TaxID=3366131 RepID=UPI00382B00B3
MSESTTAATDLTSHYTAQVASDLERNIKEQERISGDIAALQQQLAALQHDHAVLLNMQQALGAAPAQPEAEAPAGSTTVPAPRRKRGAKEAAEQPKRGRRSTSAARRAPGRESSGRAAGKAPARAAGGAKAKGTSEGPKLVDLVRGHLAEQGEPRSAAEITRALGAAHPERAVKITVVRSTLEGLVARNRAQRSKQGSSVFYSAPDATAPDTGEGDASAS